VQREYLFMLLALIVLVAGILCYVTRLTADQFLQVIFAVLGFIGGVLYERARRRIRKANPVPLFFLLLFIFACVGIGMTTFMFLTGILTERAYVTLTVSYIGVLGGIMVIRQTIKTYRARKKKKEVN